MEISSVNKINRGLRYERNEREFRFYYNDLLLFRHDTQVPFITLRLPDGEFPLYGCNAFRESANEYHLEFYQAKYKISCVVRESDGVIDFFIDNPIYPEITFALDKEGADVSGICALPGEEKKLSFYMEGRYLFGNVNVTDYDVVILDKVFVSVRQKRIRFYLDTVNTPEDVEKAVLEGENGTAIVKSREIYEVTFDEQSVSDRHKDGVILEKIIDRRVPCMKQKFGKVIKYLRPVFYSCDYLLTFFTPDDLVRTEEGKKKVNFKKKDAFVGFKSLLRKVLNSGVDGIYFDTRDYSAGERNLIYLAAKTVFPEYDRKLMMIYNAVSPTSDVFGYYVLSQNKIRSFNKETLKAYRDSGEYLTAAEVGSYNDVEKIPEFCKMVLVKRLV